MSGWIALRFLKEPSTAAKHFAHIDEGTADPIVLARAAYWRGRAAEVGGRVDDTRTEYEAAARYPTAYYGQLARARLGLGKPSLEVYRRHRMHRNMSYCMPPTALARGLSIERYVFPRIGIPAYKPIAPAIEQRIVYSIVRTESGFNQRDRSPANAVGLMQVTPEAGRDTAKRFGAVYDWNRMVSDPVYNMQMGAGELSALLK